MQFETYKRRKKSRKGKNLAAGEPTGAAECWSVTTNGGSRLVVSDDGSSRAVRVSFGGKKIDSMALQFSKLFSKFKILIFFVFIFEVG